ncbi:hypothetical protein RISK_000174 [Rhodopirellula islandica]|uniref:Uncharacterized protein n=1 Tax=Rhodopirellula islandica TaxID=595434 RepID=A0A0J1BMQ1_RHOIS|nr:hypothetical protein RISK_000174 [Rhodopirellula islandica]
MDRHGGCNFVLARAMNCTREVALLAGSRRGVAPYHFLHAGTHGCPAGAVGFQGRTAGRVGSM